RLMRKGLSRRAAAIILWAGSGLFALLTLAVYKFHEGSGTQLVYLSAAIWGCALLFFLRIPSED
ncbi:MAG: hypothetical protein WCL22_06160, partial [bacterium]